MPTDIITGMPATAKPRTTPTWTRRNLQEWSAATAGSPLRIDKDKRVIYGVKVLGRFSRNSHGLREATNGTEYTRRCMEEALPLYEGVEVLANHDPSNKARGVEDVIGVLRNCRVEDDGIRADLHYLESHRTTAAVLEDVERAIGVFGLSHDAEAGKERFDRVNRRLVIESLKSVRSVDLVRKPASNRNLWESEPVNKTLRQLLEALKLTPVRQNWRKRLLEDDGMGPVMDAPVEAPAGDPLTEGIKAAVMAIIDDGELDAAGKVGKIKLLLTTHEKLTAAPEPEEPVKEEEEPAKDKKDDDKSDDKKSESLKADLDKANHKLKVRQLCEDAGLAKPDKTLLETLESVPEATARKLIEREKARGTGTGKPTSSGPPAGGAGDFKPAANGADFAKRIKG